MAEPSNVHKIVLTEMGDLVMRDLKERLKEAKRAELTEVVIVGRTKHGKVWSTSSLNAAQTLWLIEKLKADLLEQSPWQVV